LYSPPIIVIFPSFRVTAEERPDPARRERAAPDRGQVERRMKKTCAIILIGCLSLACRLGAQHEEALRQIAAQESAGNLRGAIASIETALKAAPGAEALVLRLRELNKKFYLDSAPPSSDDAYKVRAGDTLTSIARAHCITPELIMRLNGLRDDRLRRDQALRVVKGPFDAHVIKQSYTLEIRRGDATLFTYRVGLGKDGSTPTGVFVAGAKLKNPTQFDREKRAAIAFGAPDHTLGTRWITLLGEYGIHGTVEPESIGKQLSKGCIRLCNEDVEQVFDLLVPGKSKVTVVEAP
jgi:lipoprotein-anchoring transpeptidase ErfK/SrfK